jgi:hypothetical protein
MTELSLKTIIDGVIAKGSNSVLFGGKRTRGPINTADIIYECMIGVALELTERLPQMFEHERQKYEQHQKYYKEFGHKGRYTDSYGWDKSRENKIDFNFDPVFFHYFNRIIVPFMGGKKKAWTDENSKIWKWVKNLIISGDKEKITRLQVNIRNRILKESKKRIIRVAVNGTNDQEPSESRIIKPSDI